MAEERIWTEEEIEWYKIIEASGLFDKDFYHEQHPEIKKDLLAHYIEYGSSLGYRPNDWFDGEWYYNHYEDVAKLKVNPLVHYILYGKILGYKTEPLKEDASGRVWTKEEKEWYQIIEQSGWFDTDYYLKRYPEVKEDGKDPLAHYIEVGSYQGYWPAIWFDSEWYLQHYQEVKERGINPFVHYLTEGHKKGYSAREPLLDREWSEEEKEWYAVLYASKAFDVRYYMEKYPDVEYCGKEPFAHYIERGMKESRRVNSWFDPEFYAMTYPDIEKMDPLVHYLLYGKKEGRNYSNIEKNDEEKVIKEKNLNIKYKIEKFDEEEAKGWLIDKENPEDTLPITVHVDNQEVAKIYNNQIRNDLKKKGITQGKGGWWIEYKKEWFSKESHEICIYFPDGTSKCKEFTNILKPEYKLSLKEEDVNEKGIYGWLVNLNNPEEIVSYSLFIDNVLFGEMKADIYRDDLKRHKLSAGKGGIEIKFPKNFFDSGKHTIKIVLPDAEEFNFNFETYSNIGNVIPCALSNMSKLLERTAIIVPIYNAPADVEVCIERLLQYTSRSVEIILINDKSTDPKIETILEKIKNNSAFNIINNEANLGFTRTVNKGIALAQDKHVVFLNSDARVTPRWLEGMLRALSKDPRIATVTAMSDRAGAFSAPNIGNENSLPEGVSEIDYAIAFRRRSRGYYPTVPTGNGFCMLVRRETINKIGALDEEAFPRGYGEENDFCMRARKAGWRNIIDDRTYVFHDRSKSFQGEKDHLIKAGRAVVDQRYPDYVKAIKVFQTSLFINAARFHAKQAIVDCRKKLSLPRSLYVVATQTGGTPQTNKDLMGAVQDKFETWILQCNSKELKLSYYTPSVEQEIEYYILNEALEPLTHISSEYDMIVSSWLERYQFEVVHIRHLAWHSLSLPKLAKESGAFVVNSFHDYYTVCPTIKLLDNNMHYCSGTCTEGNGQCKIELWDTNLFPELKNNYIDNWREKFRKPLQYCDAFITTSPSAKKTIMNIYADVIDNKKFYIIPHGRDLEMTSFDSEYKSSDKFHILVPGNLGYPKGSTIIKKLLEVDTEGRLYFHILGKWSDPFDHPRIRMHGPYNRSDFPEKVKKISPMFGMVFSIWNETWCHTLTELWSVGLPVLVLDYETLAKRVNESGGGWIYDHRLDIHDLYNAIIKNLTDEEDIKRKYDAVLTWQKGYGAIHTNKYMASQYLNIYPKINYGKSVDIILPVYNALQDVKNCITSLYKYETYPFNLIVIDDHSDKETENYLKAEKEKRNFTLIRNEENLRFTKSVNKGFGISTGDIVILLNSDTSVTPRWIEKIVSCFRSDKKIGIVGPLSNAASWQTVPVRADKQKGGWLVNEIPDGYSIKEMGFLVETISKQRYPEVPSVNGFCYALKRDVLVENGILDEEYFPTGYGEEDDFSIRAVKAGYKIVVADDTYIFHAKSKSYTHEVRKVLTKGGRNSLDKKHGKDRIEKLVNDWKNEPELPKIANHIESYMQIAGKNKKVVYTAIFGNYDELKEPDYVNQDWDYICFTDNRKLKSNIYTIKYVDPVFENPTKNARMIKILSHIFLIGYDYSLWIDGSVKIRGRNIDELIQKHKKNHIALHKHEIRECVFDEAEACIKAKKDDYRIIQKQIDRYKKEGLPENIPLAETAEILRNHNQKDTRRLNILWWNELNQNSIRDQISFAYICWKYQFKYSIMEGIQWIDPYFQMYAHKKYILISETPEVGIGIVLTGINAKELEELIENIRLVTKYDNYKIYIINMSDDKNLENKLQILNNRYDKIKILSNFEPATIEEAKNIIAEYIDTKYVCFLDENITVLESNWLHLLVNEMVLHKKTAIVGACILDGNFNISSTGIEVSTDDSNNKIFNNRIKRTGRSLIDAVNEKCILVDRLALLEIDGFSVDAELEHSTENLCLKFKEKKYETRFVLYCQVIDRKGR